MTSTSKPSFLKRLLRDKAGNAMFITALSIVPVAGMVGGAVDLSRTYLVKNRMQQACDAAALAGRRSMAGSTLTDIDKAEAMRYFRFNFPDQTMGAAGMSDSDGAAANRVTVARTNDGQVRVTATTTVPTTLLKVVDINDIRVVVQCLGEEFYVNTDVMLVLDTTGSMNCTISDASTCGNVTEKVNSKMASLRQAVKDLYVNLRPAQQALEAKSLRMRIGFVQYASNVNVGKLIYAENANYINNPAQDKYRQANDDNDFDDGPSRPNGWFTGTASVDWSGCITERQTNNSIVSSTTTIPSDAWDLDIARLPTGASSRWSPHVPLLYNRDTDGDGLSWFNYGNPSAELAGYSACPLPARHLESWASTTAFNNHVDTIVQGRGGTYHDIGMIWGTRMIANTGIFGPRNPDFFNNVKVRRTIVLVTDGNMAPNSDVYGAYGVERYERKTNSGGSSQTSRHEKRFNLMCDRAKSMGIDVWVVAILDASTPISASLTNCAASGQAKKVSDTSALNAAFRAISDKVGNLRIGE